MKETGTEPYTLLQISEHRLLRSLFLILSIKPVEGRKKGVSLWFLLMVATGFEVRTTL